MNEKSKATPLFGFSLALAAVLVSAGVVGGEPLVPPAEPVVTPVIDVVCSSDLNHNKIDDELEIKAASAKAQLKSAGTSKDTTSAQALLTGCVDVELIFSRQITQKQIDEFLGRGGRITYIYKTVSYGWNGSIALGGIDSLPSLMGGNLVLVQQAKPVELHLDLATQTGRVRPVWAPGFAGNPSGFDGSNTITIAIVDTGIDANHSDLAGRQVYWHDFSSDHASNPIDIIQHGSHVAGIALGTGAASGSGTATLYFTDAADLTGAPSGSFIPFSIGLPNTSLTFSSTAMWTGGGSTTFSQMYHTKGVSGGWTNVSTPASGYSPLTVTNTFTPLTSRAYSTVLRGSGSGVQEFVITSSVTDYPAVGDGFNKLRGVAPGCNWAVAKVFRNSDSVGYETWVNAAIDDLTTNRVANQIKVMNLSLGGPINSTMRQKINTAVNDGIVVVVSAGNDGGSGVIGDPGRAAMALTVAACNDEDQLTDYSSAGFSGPDSDEDYKPDITAPGGSADYYTEILSVDSGSGDGSMFADQQSNDYACMLGTSMASPFAAGAAALVIDALEQQSIVWDFYSNQHPRFVKMLLCATASETNMDRENSSYNPTLQRASGGPDGFPSGKDPYEGYGILNPDAAVEAVTLTYNLGSSAGSSLGPGAADRRVWARKMSLYQGQAVALTLTVPSSGDFDLYLYSATPSSTGAPTILASGTQAGNGIDESLNYIPPADANALIVVKRVSGSGTFVLTTQGPKIRGYVVRIDGNTPVAGVLIQADNNDMNTITDANGLYQLAVDINWSGTVTPYKYGYTFEPNSYTYTDVNHDYNDMNYTAVQFAFKITGLIKNDCNLPMQGVQVNADNGGGNDTTDVNGLYEILVDYGWSGTVTPSRPDYTFEPNCISYTDVLADFADQNYIAGNIYDLNRDCSIDLGDLGVMAQNWLFTGSGIAGDFDGDEDVDFIDFAVFGIIWQEN